MRTSRREVFGLPVAIGVGIMGTQAAQAAALPQTGHRSYWLAIAERIARPVLSNLAQGKLKARMPVEQAGSGRERYSHLEAFGRLLAGIAPWLALTQTDGAEKAQQALLVAWAQAALDRATDPASPDFLNFNTDHQPLVDAAYLALAILRAPSVLWDPLPVSVRSHLVAALESSRAIVPKMSNWIMFAATIEAFLLFAGRPTRPERLEDYIGQMIEWYVGDGHYGDGPSFHFDYYNGFVIQPMLVDCLDALQRRDARFAPAFERVMIRSARYAAIQERMIAPDGSYPPIGRSLPYRFGAFQTLAQMALRNHLPKELKPAQVREALGAVIRHTMEPQGTFDKEGWLQIGLCGHQPALAESYISTGSLYLAANGLLPLGLPQAHAFWSDPPEQWTSSKLWSGVDQPPDKALRDRKTRIDMPHLAR